jgi:hypothetical protein
MVSAAWITTDNLDDDSDDTVRTLSIKSMAEMMVARLEVPQEKNLDESM